MPGCAGVHAGWAHEHAKGLLDVQRPSGDTAGGSTTDTCCVAAAARVDAGATHGPGTATADTLRSTSTPETQPASHTKRGDTRRKLMARTLSHGAAP